MGGIGSEGWEVGVWGERWEATCGLTMGLVCAIPSCLVGVRDGRWEGVRSGRWECGVRGGRLPVGSQWDGYVQYDLASLQWNPLNSRHP